MSTTSSIPKDFPNLNSVRVRDARNEEVDLIPGTEILNDLNGFYSQRGLLETEGHIILIPEPSCDPHDPLVRLLDFVLSERSLLCRWVHRC